MLSSFAVYRENSLTLKAVLAIVCTPESLISTPTQVGERFAMKGLAAAAALAVLVTFFLPAPSAEARRCLRCVPGDQMCPCYTPERKKWWECVIEGNRHGSGFRRFHRRPSDW